MSVQSMVERFQDLMEMIGERVARVTKLEILVPIVKSLYSGMPDSISGLQRLAASVANGQKMSEGLVNKVLPQAEWIAVTLYHLPERFLRSLYIRQRMSSLIEMIETVRPLTARELRESLRDYENLLRWDESPIEEIEESFISLATQIVRIHREVIAEQIEQVIKPEPAKKRASGKSTRSLADAEQRARMKGTGGSKPAKGTSNPKKAARRERKAACVKGKKKGGRRKKVTA